MSLLLDPKVFNYGMIILSALAALRFAVSGSWADVCYWVSAFAITATVTWGYSNA